MDLKHGNVHRRAGLGSLFAEASVLWMLMLAVSLLVLVSTRHTDTGNLVWYGLVAWGVPTLSSTIPYFTSPGLYGSLG